MAVFTGTIDDLRPMELTAGGKPFSHADWAFEIKFDGYRLLAEKTDRGVELRTRQGHSAAQWFPEVVQSLARLPGGSHIFDGEVTVLDAQGRSSFSRLQRRAARRSWHEGADRVTYCIFDLLVLNGENLMALPYCDRKEMLQQLLLAHPLPSILYVSHLEGAHGALVYHAGVVPLKLEGLVAKKKNSVYQPGTRSRDWIKVKRPGAVPRERFARVRRGP